MASLKNPATPDAGWECRKTSWSCSMYWSPALQSTSPVSVKAIMDIIMQYKAMIWVILIQGITVACYIIFNELHIVIILAYIMDPLTYIM